MKRLGRTVVVSAVVVAALVSCGVSGGAAAAADAELLDRCLELERRALADNKAIEIIQPAFNDFMVDKIDAVELERTQTIDAASPAVSPEPLVEDVNVAPPEDVAGDVDAATPAGADGALVHARRADARDGERGLRRDGRPAGAAGDALPLPAAEPAVDVRPRDAAGRAERALLDRAQRKPRPAELGDELGGKLGRIF